MFKAEDKDEVLRETEKLLRTAAHDLRGPIGGIGAMADLLLENSTLPADQEELVVMIKEAARHSLQIVQELLVKDSKPANAGAEKIDLNGIIAHCLKLVRHEAAQKRQTITLNLCHDPAPLQMNADHLCRVIGNLVSNAVKFTPEGGLITLRIELLGQWAQIMVKDNGIGIPEYLQPNLFSGNGGRTGTQGEPSFGLGLPACKRMVEAYGGSISFQSRPGKGAIFYVWLPVA